MDKETLNLQIVAMRKIVKDCQRRFQQKMKGKIRRFETRLQKAKDRGDQKNLPKFQKRTERYKKDYVMIKTVDRDDISKFALSNTRNLNKMEPSSPEERIKVGVAKQPLIQSAVKKFREENPTWNLWLDSLIELWDEKRELKGGQKKGGKRDKPQDDKSTGNSSSVKKEKKKVDLKELTIPKKDAVVAKLDAKSFKITEVIKPKAKIGKKEKERRNQVEESECFPQKVIAKGDSDGERDDFFVGDKIKKKKKVESVNQSFDTNLKNVAKNFKRPKDGFDGHEVKKVNKMKKESIVADTSGLHPSWEAKKKQKVTFENKKSKHIKFD